MRTFLLACAVMLGMTRAAAADCLAYLPAAEQYHGIPRGLLQSIAIVESGRKGVPHPWTLNIGGAPVYDPDYNTVARRLYALMQSGQRNVDIGCMQINARYHAHRFAHPLHLLDPRTNVFYAGYYLRELYQETGNWTTAVARYHSSSLSRQVGYVCNVWRALTAIGGNADPRGGQYCSTKSARRN